MGWFRRGSGAAAAREDRAREAREARGRPPGAGGPAAAAPPVDDRLRRAAAPGGGEAGPRRLDRHLEAALRGASRRVREQFLQLPAERYTTPHGLAVAACTFNANAQLPPAGLDLAAATGDLGDERNRADVYAFGFQEVVPLSVGNVVADGMGRADPHGYATGAWEDLVEAHLNAGAKKKKTKKLAGGGGKKAKYVRVAAQQMVGIYLTVWVKASLRGAVAEAQTTSVGCGVMGVLGNKGCVAAWLKVYDTSVCVLCAHLSSGQGPLDLLRRNADAADILERVQFPGSGAPGAAVGVADADHCLLVGDLNYRLNADDAEVRARLGEGGAGADGLLELDQLRQEMAAGNAFRGWAEQGIAFPPTYKFRRHTDVYAGDPERPDGSQPDLQALEAEALAGGDEAAAAAAAGVGEGGKPPPKRKEKKKDKKVRTPAWCDRILWKPARELRAQGYRHVPAIKFSDHRMVTASFALEVRQYKDADLKAAFNEAYRLADLQEMQEQPRLEVQTNTVDFGDVRYCRPAQAFVKVTNVGTVNAFWQIECAEGDFPPWLSVHPLDGKLAPGAELELCLVAHVEGGVASSAEYLSFNTMDTILILSTEGGGAAFLSLQAHYVTSCFGLTIDSLVQVRPPLRSTPLAAAGRGADGGGPAEAEAGVAEAGAVAAEVVREVVERVTAEAGGGGGPAGFGFAVEPQVPLEIQRLIHFLAARGLPEEFILQLGEAELGSHRFVRHFVHGFASHGSAPLSPGGRRSDHFEVREQVKAIREALDADAAFGADVTSAGAFAALLLLFNEMPQPLLPESVSDLCRLCIPSKFSAEKLLSENMSYASKATFYYVMAWLDRVEGGVREAVVQLFAALLIKMGDHGQAVEGAGQSSAASARAVEFVNLFLGEPAPAAPQPELDLL